MRAYPAAAMKQLALLQLAAANHIQIKHRPGSVVRRPTVGGGLVSLRVYEGQGADIETRMIDESLMPC